MNFNLKLVQTVDTRERLTWLPNYCKPVNPFRVRPPTIGARTTVSKAIVRALIACALHWSALTFTWPSPFMVKRLIGTDMCTASKLVSLGPQATGHPPTILVRLVMVLPVMVLRPVMVLPVMVLCLVMVLRLVMVHRPIMGILALAHPPIIWARLAMVLHPNMAILVTDHRRAMPNPPTASVEATTFNHTRCLWIYSIQFFFLQNFIKSINRCFNQGNGETTKK